ncbi:hypothetical protein FB99_07360 [Pantoea agglomerans]|nr:hypothetical protein FB99_07360 [Pantoea agglomerans]
MSALLMEKSPAKKRPETFTLGAFWMRKKNGRITGLKFACL